MYKYKPLLQKMALHHQTNHSKKQVQNHEKEDFTNCSAPVFLIGKK